MTTFAPTDEQTKAVALFRTGANLAIEAGSGTGKTSTLRLLGEAAPNTTMQYVAFSRAIADEAAEKMPSNVFANTAHALAFRAVGRRYAHRLKSGRMKSMEIARRLRIDPLTIRYGSQSKPMSAGYLAGLAMRTVTIFCQSADLAPTDDHVPYVDGIDVPYPDGRRSYVNNRQVRAHIMPAVRRAWEDLLDPNGQLPYKHEHYLKTWHLSDPVIAADVILFDECQDASPVLLAVVEAQDHAQRVYVGDSNQAIFGFTGALNALDRIRALGGETAWLTNSFRFGPAVADVANGLLARIGTTLRLTGVGPASVVGVVADPDVVLCRTNAQAVRTVLEAVAGEKSAALVGGGSEVASFARAAADLQEGRWVSHPDLACFSTWGEVADYVQNDEQGSDLKLLFDLVTEFGTDRILAAVDGTTSEAKADVVVSTAHKSKGREWGSVQLASDFFQVRDGEHDLSVDELRLLYVATTRARRELDVTACPQALAPPRGRGLPVQQPIPLGPVPAAGPVDDKAAAFELTRRYGTRQP